MALPLDDSPVSQTANAHATHSAEIYQMIQSMQFAE